jgi:hypothetical protein
MSGGRTLVLFSSQNSQKYLQNEKHGNELYIDLPEIAFNLQIIDIGMVMIKFYNYHIKFLLLTMLEGACLSYVKASMVRYETYEKCETKLNGGYLTSHVQNCCGIVQHAKQKCSFILFYTVETGVSSRTTKPCTSQKRHKELVKGI